MCNRSVCCARSWLIVLQYAKLLRSPPLAAEFHHTEQQLPSCIVTFYCGICWYILYALHSTISCNITNLFLHIYSCIADTSIVSSLNVLYVTDSDYEGLMPARYLRHGSQPETVAVSALSCIPWWTCWRWTHILHVLPVKEQQKEGYP